MSKTYKSSINITIPFFDVDSMGVTWHGHYAKYLELARCKLLEDLDYSYQQMQESGYAWPIVSMKLKYIKPANFGQVVTVTAKLLEYENCLKINYIITDQDGQVLTKGQTMQMAIDMQTGQTCFVSPDILLDKFK